MALLSFTKIYVPDHISVTNLIHQTVLFQIVKELLKYMIVFKLASCICVSAQWLSSLSIGKEVIQPQVPLRLPCYDFTPVMNHTVVSDPLAVSLPTSGTTHSHGVTGGVYKARERIHRDILIRDY